MEIVSVIDYFSNYSGLKTNISKSDIDSIGALKRVDVAVCGLKSVALQSHTVKILGIHFSYSNEIRMKKTSAKQF